MPVPVVLLVVYVCVIVFFVVDALRNSPHEVTKKSDDMEDFRKTSKIHGLPRVRSVRVKRIRSPLRRF